MKRISSETKAKYLHALRRHGQDSVYRKAVGNSIINLQNDTHPEIELLDLSEAFFILYRRSGEYEYFTLSRVLRRAAHAVYRELLRMGHNNDINIRFLNVVRS